MIIRKPFIQSSISPFRICYRCLHKSVQPHRVPPPTPFVPDSATFLTLIGRDLSKHASKFPSWESLFTMSSAQIKEAGIEPPRTRRYLLRWIEKFRKGEYGVGGDLKYVKDGEAEIRVVEIPRIKKPAEGSEGHPNPGSIDLPPGKIRLVVNLPFGETEPKGSSAALKKVSGMSLRSGTRIRGSHIEHKAGTGGSVGILRVKEGLWEHKRGQKVDGGERRRAEVRWRRAVEEHRKNNP